MEDSSNKTVVSLEVFQREKMEDNISWEKPCNLYRFTRERTTKKGDSLYPVEGDTDVPIPYLGFCKLTLEDGEILYTQTYGPIKTLCSNAMDRLDNLPEQGRIVLWNSERRPFALGELHLKRIKKPSTLHTNLDGKKLWVYKLVAFRRYNHTQVVKHNLVK